MDVIFQTERINFILPRIDLVQEYMDLVNNPNIYQFITTDHHDYTYENEVDWVNRHQDATQFTMINRENGDFIENLGFNEIEGNTCEIGIIIREDYQNNHYGREALTALINYAFENLNVNEITLVAFDNNDRTLQCYRNVGFETYQIIENVGIINGNVVNDVYMRLRRQ